MNILKNIGRCFKGNKEFITNNLTTKNKPLSILIALILLMMVMLSNPLMVIAVFGFCVLMFVLTKK